MSYLYRNHGQYILIFLSSKEPVVSVYRFMVRVAVVIFLYFTLIFCYIATVAYFQMKAKLSFF